MNPTTNSRGGINKLGTKEKAGVVTSGSTGELGTAEFKPGTPVAPINRTNLTSLQNTPSLKDVPPPSPMADFSDIIARYRPQERPEGASAADTLQRQLGQRNAAYNAAESAAGLDGLYSRSSELSQQIADLTGSFGMAIQQQDGFVRPQEFITGRQTYLQNQKAAQVEALAAAQAAVDGKIGLAEQRIDQAIEREFGTIEAQLAAATEDYNRNKDAYDRMDKNASEERAALLQERSDQLATQKAERTEILKLMATAAQNGAPTNVISQISRATNMEGALTAGSAFLNAPASPEYREVGDNLLKIDPTTGAVSVVYGKGLTGSYSDIVSNGGSLIEAVEATAGGKPVSQSFVETWSKGQSTLDQVERLGDAFAADTALFGEDNGILQPITAVIRSNNPLDTKAKEINALLNTIVPNLARGIYGEVGVLTDTDFQKYADTLPTLASTQEVQDAVLGITLKAIQGSLTNRLETEAKAGNDVSGFANDIEQIERRVGTLMAPANMKLPTTQQLIEAGASESDVRALYEAGYTPEAVEAYYMGETDTGQMSFNDAIDKSAEAIAAVESGGNYQAMGPVLNSGMYSGDRAYGKYQIMGRNIPAWSQEILGRSITAQEFLQNPQLQDAIFKGKFAQAARQHGTLDDAASVWFSGRPLAKAGGAKDQLGTSVPEYVKRFRNNFHA